MVFMNFDSDNHILLKHDLVYLV